MSAEQREKHPPTRRLGEPQAPAEDDSPADAVPADRTQDRQADKTATRGGGRSVGAPSEAGLDEELEAARRQRDEYLDMVRRVQADFENYKKRMVRQQTDLLERAAESLVVKLLPVLDAFELASAHLEAEGSAQAKTLLAATGLLSDTLAKEGLERFGDDGEVFDPSTHEAVDHEPADPEPASLQTAGAYDQGDGAGHHEPVVSAVLRPGYRYKGRVVRPAMVKVRG